MHLFVPAVNYDRSPTGEKPLPQDLHDKSSPVSLSFSPTVLFIGETDKSLISSIRDHVAAEVVLVINIDNIDKKLQKNPPSVIVITDPEKSPHTPPEKRDTLKRILEITEQRVGDTLHIVITNLRTPDSLTAAFNKIRIAVKQSPPLDITEVVHCVERAVRAISSS